MEGKMMLFFLVCGGAFLVGVINVLQRYYLKGRAVRVEAMIVETMLVAAVFVSLVQFFLLGIPKVSSGFWLPLGITAPLYVGMVYCLTKAYKLEDASIVASLQGIAPIFIILTSWLLLREFPTSFGLIGIGCIVLGTYILNLKGLDVELPRKFQRIIPKRLYQPIMSFLVPWIRLSSSKGACLSLLAALLGSIALVFAKRAVLNSNPMILDGCLFLTACAFIYGKSKINGQWKGLDKKYFWPIFGIGLLVGLSELLMTSGFFFGIVPYVGSLKRTEILFTAILAGIFLGEKHALLRFGAAAIIVIGVVLIAF